MLRRENNALVREYASETLVIEPWGKDSLHVRSTMRPSLDQQDWALLRVESSNEPNISIERDGRASITNGGITARVDPKGQVGFFNQKGEILLEEFMRVRLGDMTSDSGQIDQAAVSYFTAHRPPTHAVQTDHRWRLHVHSPGSDRKSRNRL
jgi:hypothetical protein